MKFACGPPPRLRASPGEQRSISRERPASSASEEADCCESTEKGARRCSDLFTGDLVLVRTSSASLAQLPRDARPTLADRGQFRPGVRRIGPNVANRIRLAPPDFLDAGRLWSIGAVSAECSTAWTGRSQQTFKFPEMPRDGQGGVDVRPQLAGASACAYSGGGS